jgi:hypothetical protein
MEGNAMAKTTTDLFRAVMGKPRDFTITLGELPGEDILHPRFESTRYFSRGEWRNTAIDLPVNNGNVEANNGGTSLHDAPRWFAGVPDFWIPTGTEYSDELYIRKGAHKQTSEKTGATGFHYQLEPRTRMTQVTFMGYLANMARAAVERQVALGHGKKKDPVEKKTSTS